MVRSWSAAESLPSPWPSPAPGRGEEALRSGALKSQLRQHGASSSKSLSAPIKAFKGDDFVVGVGPMETTFKVSAVPHQDGGNWKMTVDGEELVRR